MRIPVVLCIFIALATGSVTAASAQGSQGSITGRVYHTDSPAEIVRGSVVAVPIEATQPVPVDTLFASYLVEISPAGTYTLDGLSAGEYLVGLFRVASSDRLPGLTHEILVQEGDSLEAVPAGSVVIPPGGTVEFDIVIVPPPPAPTPGATTTPQFTGGVSGQITFTGRVPSAAIELLWLPVDVEQPVPSLAYADNVVSPDSAGNYQIVGLDDGEYFVVPPRGPEVVAPQLDKVDIHYSLRGRAEADEMLHDSEGDSHQHDDAMQEILENGLVVSQPAIRVEVVGGQMTRGVDFTLRFSEPRFVSVDPEALPDLGSGTGSAGVTSAYLASFLAFATACALIGSSVAVFRWKRAR